MRLARFGADQLPTNCRSLSSCAALGGGGGQQQ
jgi:hypothetical protein